MPTRAKLTNNFVIYYVFIGPKIGIRGLACTHEFLFDLSAAAINGLQHGDKRTNTFWNNSIFAHNDDSGQPSWRNYSLAIVSGMPLKCAGDFGSVTTTGGAQAWPKINSQVILRRPSRRASSRAAS